MNDSLESWAAERGYEVAWGSIDVVRRARAEIAGRRDAQELDGALFHAELAPLMADRLTAEAVSVVVVATPSPAFRVRFDLGEGTLEAVLPPTYRRYRATFEEVRQDLAANALPGAALEHFGWPLKAVAARLGLVRYGRNNLVYAAGTGSYLQLCGYLTDADLPAEAAAEREPELLGECHDCDVCRRACPTGAIDQRRILLHAERCLTFANENPGPWPEWVPARAHNCLLGCLLCQRSCPANPRLPVTDAGLTFSRAETAALLADGAAMDGRSEDGIRKKLAWLGQPYAEPVLGRNLRALLERRR